MPRRLVICGSAAAAHQMDHLPLPVLLRMKLNVKVTGKVAESGRGRSTVDIQESHVSISVTVGKSEDSFSFESGLDADSPCNSPTS